MPGALVTLFRDALGRRWGVRGARVYGALLAVTMAAMIYVLAARFGPDATSVALLARTAALTTWIPGGIAGFALSVPPKDQALVQGISALAVAKGVDEGTLTRAEMLATIRLFAEVIVLPVLATAVFVWLIIGGAKLTPELWPMLGAIAFTIVAAAVLGVVSSICRKWAKERGRSVFLAVMFLPWAAAELLLPGPRGQLLSIPGLLSAIWHSLTMGVA